MIAPGQPSESINSKAAACAPFEQQVRARIQAVSYLPTSTSVALKFIALGKNREADSAEYLKVISSDASLSTKLLALANSSWFGVRHRVTKPAVALNLLGLSTVRTLAISYCAAGLHHGLRLTPAEGRMLWATCLFKAVATRRVALHTAPSCAEEAFACGLFQDLALPFMHSVAPDQYLPELQQAPPVTAQLALERNLFRLDHAELGRAVAQKIELPQLFVDAVALHHQPDTLRQVLEVPRLADAIEVAALFPHLLQRWNPDDAQLLRRFLEDRLDLRLQPFLSDVQREFDQLYAYFENGGVSDANLHELLQEAFQQVADNTTRLVGTVHNLMRETAQAGRQAHQAAQNQRHMEDQVLLDPLTGLLNRAGLARRAAELLTQPENAAAPLAVAFLDIDRFKSINDTVGHAGGDAALRSLANVLRRHVRHEDLVGRMGGDEFVLVLSRCSRDQAVAAVQRIVDAVAADPVCCGEVRKQVTVSAGLLWLAGGSPPDRLDQLIGESDRLMYQAKRAGGNRLQWRGAENPAAALRAAS